MIVPVEEYRQALDAMYAAAMTPARDYELVASDGVVQLTAGVCEHYDYIRLSRKRLDEAVKGRQWTALLRACRVAGCPPLVGHLRGRASAHPA